MAREGEGSAGVDILTPAEAVIGGVILYAASDPHIQAMVAANDEKRFVEGCHGPWFDQLVGLALVAVRDACDADAQPVEVMR